MQKLNFFECYVEDEETGCWNWTAGKQSMGYGMMTVKGKRMLAHRYSYELAHTNKIPKGMFVLHKCDNPACVNPDHLFLGTQKDNIRDCIKKNRHSPPPHIGQAHRKLTEKQVIKIKKLLSQGLSRRKIAKLFPVTSATIDKIADNKMWVRL